MASHLIPTRSWSLHKTLHTLLPSPSHSLCLHCSLIPILTRFLLSRLKVFIQAVLSAKLCVPQTSAKFAPSHLSESLVKGSPFPLHLDSGACFHFEVLHSHYRCLIQSILLVFLVCLLKCKQHEGSTCHLVFLRLYPQLTEQCLVPGRQ